MPKFLLTRFRKDEKEEVRIDAYTTLTSAQQVYDRAKKDEGNDGAYLSVVISEFNR